MSASAESELGRGRSSDPWVCAIVVSHDGERWIPSLVNAIAASSRRPDQVVVVDTGSTDNTVSLVNDAYGPQYVIPAPRATGFGAAVEMAVNALGDSAPDDSWIWLLHDDSAPAPDALQTLLETVEADSTIDVIGCRVRAWPRARRLLEVGVTITGTGRRETGLEPGEYDQGQHDGIRQVLGVSSAGMLVRRRVWTALGGFDPELPLFRDDVDFGWRAAMAGHRVVVSPDAVIFHAEAATRGVRPIDNTSPQPHRADRQAALYTLLANCSLIALPWQYIRLLFGSMLRAIGYLVAKLPSAARDEFLAAITVAATPWRIVSARRWRRRYNSVNHRVSRALRPAWWAPYAHGLDNLLARFSENLRETATSVSSSARLRSGRGDATTLETGPVSDEAVSLDVGDGPVAWIRTHPLAGITALFVVASFIGGRALIGSALLAGGALLPAPAGATQWWHLYGESYHNVGLGSDLVTSPYVALLGVVATVLSGSANLAVVLVLLQGCTLAAIGAYLAARRLVDTPGLRVWIAVAYGVLPVVSGAVTTGHIGTVAALVAVPWVVRGAASLVAGTRDDAGPTWRAAFATGLALSVTTAFVPVAWVMAVVIAVIGAIALALRRQFAVLPFLLVSLATPVVLLVPWSLRVMGDPALLRTEAGLVDSATVPISEHAWQLPFGRLGAIGDAPWWVTAGLLLAGLVALLRVDRLGAIAMCWAVAAVGLGTAAILANGLATIQGTSLDAVAWVGFPVVVAQGAFIVAGALAVDGLQDWMRSGTFGFRQPVAAATAAIAVLTPIAALGWWLIAAPVGELERGTSDTLPAYMSDDLVDNPGLRALVIRGGGGSVTYEIISGDGLTLGDDSVLPSGEDADSPEFDALVADVLSQGRASDTLALADLGVKYVVLPTPADSDAVTSLDGLPGLTVASTDVSESLGWQVPNPKPDVGGAVSGLAKHRGWWLTAEAILTVLVLVLATPAARRRAGLTIAEPEVEAPPAGRRIRTEEPS